MAQTIPALVGASSAMNFLEALDAYYDHTETASENARKLAFAGIAVGGLLAGKALGQGPAARC